METTDKIKCEIVKILYIDSDAVSKNTLEFLIDAKTAWASEDREPIIDFSFMNPEDLEDDLFGTSMEVEDINIVRQEIQTLEALTIEKDASFIRFVNY